METVAWYQDKAVVTGLLTALTGVYLAIRAAVPALPDIDVNIVGWVVAILASVGVFGTVTRPTNMKVGLKSRKL